MDALGTTELLCMQLAALVKTNRRSEQPTMRIHSQRHSPHQQGISLGHMMLAAALVLAGIVLPAHALNPPSSELVMRGCMDAEYHLYVALKAACTPRVKQCR